MTGRVDTHVKDRIREANDLVAVVEQCVPLRKAGSSFKARCPFHEEKTPSFNVNPAKQIWHCFGCGAGGDVFAFVMQFHGMSFPEALRSLADRAGIALPEARERSDGPGRADILHVNGKYAAWYQDVLLRQDAGAGARAYLQARGFHADVARTFGLGFAPDGWTAAVGSPELRALDDTHLTAAGLARPRQDGSLYDWFRNRIIFPIHGPAGDIVAFGGRTIGDDDAAKYINSPETVVYHKGSQLYNLERARRPIQQAGRAILVEGYFDAIRLAFAGFEETVATCGTALTEQQAKLLARYTDSVVVAYDGDDSGRAAAERAAGLLLEADVDVRLVFLPGGQDPDDVIQTSGADAFRAMLDAAADFVDFILAEWPAGHAATIEDRERSAGRMMALVERIPNPVRREMYVKKIAYRLWVEEKTVQKALSTVAPQASEAVGERGPRLRERDREPLRLALRNFEALNELEDLPAVLGDFPPVVRGIIRRIVEQRPAFESFAALMDAVEDEGERQVLRELQIVDDNRRYYPPDWLIHHLNLRRARRRLTVLRDEMRLAEAENNEAVQAQLAAEVLEMGRLKEHSRSALQAVEVEHALA